MRVAYRWYAKPVVMKCISSKRAVLESWAAENRQVRGKTSDNLMHGASALNTDPAV